jgi:hypothetical protein
MDHGGVVANLHITAWKQEKRDARPTAAFIAAARTALPACLDEIEDLRKDKARLQTGWSLAINERDAPRAALTTANADLLTAVLESSEYSVSRYWIERIIAIRREIDAALEQPAAQSSERGEG